MERDTTSQKKRKPTDLTSKPCLVSEISGSGMNFRSEVSSCASRSIEAIGLDQRD